MIRNREREIDLAQPIDPLRIWDERAAIPGLRSIMSLGLDEASAERESENLVNGIFQFLGNTIQGKDVYEIGGGIGRFTRELAKRARTVTTVDLSLPMLQRAKINIDRATNTHLVQASASEAPFSDKNFDVAFEVTTLVHMPDLYFERIVSETKRILNPNGKIFLCGPMAEETSYQIHPYLFHRTLEQYEAALHPFSIRSLETIPCGRDTYTMLLASK